MKRKDLVYLMIAFGIDPNDLAKIKLTSKQYIVDVLFSDHEKKVFYNKKTKRDKYLIETFMRHNNDKFNNN